MTRRCREKAEGGKRHNIKNESQRGYSTMDTPLAGKGEKKAKDHSVA